MTETDLFQALRTKLTVPLWPHTGQALGLSRNSTYEAARRGEIVTIRIGGAIRVPTAPLRKMLGMDVAAADASTGKAA